MKNLFLIGAIFLTQYGQDITETVSDVLSNCPAGIEKRLAVEKHGKRFILYVCKETDAERSELSLFEVEPLPPGET